jgi:hypothetical protein
MIEESGAFADGHAVRDRPGDVLLGACGSGGKSLTERQTSGQRRRVGAAGAMGAT